jgi:hypothetical protein
LWRGAGRRPGRGGWVRGGGRVSGFELVVRLRIKHYNAEYSSSHRQETSRYGEM